MQHSTRRNVAGFIVALLIIALSVPLAQAADFSDIIGFIEKRNYPLELMDKQKKWYNQIGLQLEASEDAGGFRVVVPIISPKERMDGEMRIWEYRHKLRLNIAGQLKEYYTISEQIQADMSLIDDLTKEITWLQHRTDAGIDDGNGLITKTLKLKSKKSGLQIRKAEKELILQEILSLVPRYDQKELREMLNF